MQKTRNFHADKVHKMPRGRRVLGVSHSWARSLDGALENILAASPELRHVAINVPMSDRDVLRLFHSGEGMTWRQVRPAELGQYKFNFLDVVRGAQELDGDPAFDCELTVENLRLRQIAGRLLAPRNRYGQAIQVPFDSMDGWVEVRLRKILDHAGELYVKGATNPEAQTGRRQALVTIERLIRHLRTSLKTDESFQFPELSHIEAQIEGELKRHFIRRNVPFLTSDRTILYAFENLTKAKQKQLAKDVWADAARMPRDARFDIIYGALLRQAEGHPVFGDKDYQRLESLLAEDLAAGFHVVRLNGCLFIRSGGRWRPAQSAPIAEGQAEWSHGKIISRNFGRVIVPPHRRDNQLVPGYTRNGPGEGPAAVRKAPFEMKCIDRPIHGTNLAWLHAYHAWELEQG